MVTGSITNERFSLFEQHLRAHQRAAGTIEKYVRDVRALAAWLGGTEVTRERVAAWRDSLLARGYAPETVNSMGAAANQFFAFQGWEDGPVAGDHLRHRHPGERGAVYHRGGGPGGPGGDLPEGQGGPSSSRASCAAGWPSTPGHKKSPPARSFSPEAEKVCPAARSGRR